MGGRAPSCATSAATARTGSVKTVLASAVTPYLTKPTTTRRRRTGGRRVRVDDRRRNRTDGLLRRLLVRSFSAGKTMKVSQQQGVRALAAGRPPAQGHDRLHHRVQLHRLPRRPDQELTVPTLVIHGDSDNIVPIEVTAIMERRPPFRLRRGGARARARSCTCSGAAAAGDGTVVMRGSAVDAASPVGRQHHLADVAALGRGRGEASAARAGRGSPR